MSNTSTQLTVLQQAVVDVRGLLDTEAFKKRFNEIMGTRAALFMASITNYVAASPQLAECDRKSIIASAIISATLDLPIEKSLGFAYIVPYGRQAQFQLGYRGIIQLALRSGQYARMKETCINAAAFGGYDDIGEAVIHWDKVDETEEPVGYAFAWKTVNGFTKIVYWTKDHVIKHARKYSKSYGRDSSPWTTNFDAMALKTVIRAGLSKYGIMSIDLQKGIQSEDIQMTVDDKGDLVPIPEAPDAEPRDGQQQPPQETVGEKLRKKRTPKDVTPGQGGNPPAEPAPTQQPPHAAEPREVVPPTPAAAPTPTPEPAKAADTVAEPVQATQAPDAPDKQALIDAMQDQMIDMGVSEQKLLTYARKIQGMVPADCKSVWDLPSESLAKLRMAIKALAVGREPKA